MITKAIHLTKRITDYRGYNYNFYGRNFLTLGSVLSYALDNATEAGLSIPEKNGIKRLIRNSKYGAIRLTIEQIGLVIVSAIHLEKDFYKVLIDEMLKTRRVW